jgi:DNA-binding NarL/FixJ family response regulator
MTITVYLADDHTILRDGLKLLLQLQPNFVIVGEAGDGRQAVHDVQKLQPDVVIMDVLMPELNGIEATRQITQTTPHSKIIMLSAKCLGEHGG